MRLKVKKLVGKAYVGLGVMMIGLTPTFAEAAAPSSYVNKVTGKLYSEAASISLKLALLAMIGFLIAYMMTGDEHKKAKLKGFGLSTIGALLLIGILPDLVTWIQGAMK